MNFNSLPPEGQILVKRFKSRLPQRLELDYIVRFLPQKRIDGLILLDIGLPSPVMSALLRENGGAWATIARSPENAEEASAFLAAKLAPPVAEDAPVGDVALTGEEPQLP